MKRLAGPWICLVAWLGLACGKEDIELAPDGGASIPHEADIPPEASVAIEGGRSCNLPPGRVCLGNGTSCAVDAECCSFRCASGLCMPMGCSPPGTACASRDSCCSGRCEPVEVRVGDAGGDQTILACLPICLGDGATCRTGRECCSLGCHAGKCGGPVCSLGDGGLGTDSCRTSDDAPCRSTADSCGGLNQAACCSGVCNAAAGRCEFSPGPCLPVGSICVQDADCCRGTCAADATGVPVCTAPCLGDGQSCTLAADCCNGYCNGAAGQCASAPPVCKRIGAACGSDLECCSGQCLSGSCGSNCSMP